MTALVIFLLGILLLACLFPGFRAFLMLGSLIAYVWIASIIHDAPINAERAAKHRADCAAYTRTHNTVHPNCTQYH